MKTIIKAFTVLASLIIITNCSSVSKEDKWAEFCANTIWDKHGYYDATHGFSYKMMAIYRERCGNQFSNEDSVKYQTGYIQGAKTFCTYENGFKLGNRNEKNPKSCPIELADNFNKGFASGRAEYHRTQNFIESEKEREERRRASSGGRDARVNF